MADLVQDSLAPTVKLLAERTAKNRQTQPVDGQLRLRWAFANSYQVDSESELHHVCSIVPRLRVVGYTEMRKPESLLVRVGKKVAASAESLSRRIASLVGIAWEQKKKPEKPPALQQGDIIRSVGGVQNPTYAQMRRIVRANKDKPVSVTVLRTGANGVEEPHTVTVVPRGMPGSKWVQIGAALELDAEHPVVADTIETGQDPAKLDIPSGATITAVDGTPVSSFYDVVKEIKKYPGERITIDYRLDDETAGAVVFNVGEPKETITIKSALADRVSFEVLKSTYKADGPVDAVVMGYRKTTALIAQTYLTIRRLIGGIVSPKELMGPVGILSVSYDVVAEKMWIEYLFLIGLINAAIAVFNFLPLPPLDGGLFVFLMVEKVKGSAISERAQGLVIRAGWVLVLAIILYITFNDVVRNFFS
jgi:RIP metalloprotease RseP